MGLADKMTEKVMELKGGNKVTATTTTQKKSSKATTLSIMEYDEAYYTGMVRKGKDYSICYEIPNVTFQGISKERQKEVNEGFVTILNSFDNFLKITLVIANIKEDLNTLAKTKYKTDVYPIYSSEINVMLEERLSVKDSISTYKLFVIKGTFESAVEADNQFRSICNNLDDLFSTFFSVKGSVMSIGKRFHLITTILNKDNYNPYLSYDKDTDDYSIDIDLLNKQHLTLDDVIKPTYLKFGLQDFKLNDRIGRSMYLQKIGNSLSTDFLFSLYSIPTEMVIAVDMSGVETGDAIHKLNNKYSMILSEIEQKDGFTTLAQMSEQESIVDMQDAIMNRDEKMYNASLILTIFAEDKDKLISLKRQVHNKAKRYTCGFEPVFSQQKYGLSTCCLMGFYNVEFKRFMPAHALGAFIPFDVPQYFDVSGIYYGLHKVNNQPVFYDRNKNANYNALILGSSGSGKSFLVKKEILLTRLKHPKDNIYVIDPDGEYTLICTALGGEVIELKPGNGVNINPLDLDIDTSMDKSENPITQKSDFVASLVETMMGENIILNAKARGILDRCVIQIYQPYLEHLSILPPDKNGRKPTIDRDACPTLQDLYDQLLKQPQAEAQEIAISIESYINGSFDTFAHRTNVDISNTFIDFDISGLGSSMLNLGLRICLSELWIRMIANRAKNIWTRMYIDEFHNLLSSALSAQFCKKLWKQARKWMGAPTGITQNTEDLLQSSEARAIINNSGLVILLNQSSQDQEILADILKLDEADLKYINKVKPGSGMIVTASQIIPFYDEFPQNTECYKLLSTSPND